MVHYPVYPLIYLRMYLLIDLFVVYIGILDQGKGHLLIHETSTEDISFSKGGEIITNMGSVVEALYGRAKNIISQKSVAPITV